jgi:hypothetical protein
MSESSFKSKSPKFRCRPIKTIPPTLESLFKQADFINNVGSNQKICFNTHKYYDKNGWWGWYKRNSNGDSMDDLVKKITSLKDQLFDQYRICRDPDFADLILTELVGLRSACIRLRDTTYSGETDAFDEFSSLIRAIGVSLPENIKRSQGISKIGAVLYEQTPFTEQEQKSLTEEEKKTVPALGLSNSSEGNDVQKSPNKVQPPIAKTKTPVPSPHSPVQEAANEDGEE